MNIVTLYARCLHPFAPPLALSALLVGLGCAQIQESDDEQVIIVPSAADSTPQYHGDGSIPLQRYVVRMSDGQRDWEVEFPDVARGYEVRIPLEDSDRDVHAGYHPLTQADKELIDHLRRTDPDFERQGIYGDGEHLTDRQDAPQDEREARDSDGPSEADPAPTRPSYFRGIDEAQRLFEAGHYEMAMIRLADLENAYPNDGRIKSMKGTLWLRLGREDLARQTWEQVLQIDPDNQPVMEALRRLDGTATDELDGLDEE